MPIAPRPAEPLFERADRPVETIDGPGASGAATPVCTAVVEDYLPCGQLMRMGSRPSQFSAASRT